MSSETQPDPLLPNYNPSSWDVPTLSAEERAVLDTEYITFPLAQNQNITFPVAPTAPTLATGTNTTQVATTGFVQNAISAFLSSVNTWLGTQIFNAGMTSNTINSTTSGGILTIGNTATSISLGTTGTVLSLGCPLTPSYAYTVAGTGVGKIGEIIIGTGTPPAPLTINTPQTCLQFSAGVLAVGTWLISASLFRNTTAAGYIIIALNTTTNSLTGVIAQDTAATVNSLGPGQTLNWVVEVPDALTEYFLIGQTGTAGNWIAEMRAIRIA
jgi:hypothetical protein